jgi:hypothetical protein
MIAFQAHGADASSRRVSRGNWRGRPDAFLAGKLSERGHTEEDEQMSTAPQQRMPAKSWTPALSTSGWVIELTGRSTLQRCASPMNGIGFDDKSAIPLNLMMSLVTPTFAGRFGVSPKRNSPSPESDEVRRSYQVPSRPACEPQPQKI